MATAELGRAADAAEGPDIAVESLFPDWQGELRAHINGRIISAARCRCGRNCCHCQLASHGGIFAAVYGSDRLPRRPTRGEIIGGDYWLWIPCKSRGNARWQQSAGPINPNLVE